MIRKDLPKKVLVLGSGGLQIGQAGEFDYSGSQALKALREEGIETVLINPNIASVQTDWDMADAVYFLPLESNFIEEVIQKENVDSILLSFGGQTALNCGLELDRQGILEKYNVKVLGTSLRTIDLTEDRKLFALSLAEIGVPVAQYEFASSVAEALVAAEGIGFPVMIRTAYTLGGKGSSIIKNKEECLKYAEKALKNSSHVLVEECLAGWKEFEYEVMRDGQDNCLIVCNMENIDPMGIHTGDSIVVAPSQTLDDVEYQRLRDIALKTVRHLDIVGECNIQFALDKESRTFKVIEVNARLSRSSALASKATGYPIAYVAAKVILGYELAEIKNAMTGVTTAFFEPAMDYIVCKVPRWDFDKFPDIVPLIGSEMRSIGEVMSIGHSFGEAIQKALRMVGLNYNGPSALQAVNDYSVPSPTRILSIFKALKGGVACSVLAEATGIDQFFLNEMKVIVNTESEIVDKGNLDRFDALFFNKIKKLGVSDERIGDLVNAPVQQVIKRRQELGVRPYLLQIDTLAAEYPAVTNFTYLSYGASQHDSTGPHKKERVLILGAGCYRIGSSVEFDWCAVNCSKALRQMGYETILLNCNPETVSTDFDNCDVLVFDEISVSNILELCELYNPIGVVVSMGGQVPNNLAKDMEENGIPILGTPPHSINLAEDRSRFSTLLNKLEIDQPQWCAVNTLEDIRKNLDIIGGFPVLVRPSFVLSGTRMGVAYNEGDLQHLVSQAQIVSPKHPVILSKFEKNAREIEFDAVGQNGEIVVFAFAEHIENAGVHSGDATLVLPTFSLSQALQKRMQRIASSIAASLKVCGPFNIQFLIKDESVKVIECNLRASRSLPFVSKSAGANFVEIAVKAMLGESIPRQASSIESNLPYFAVKSPQFSFERMPGVDPCLGVEMASTGEVACLGQSFEEALLLSVLSSGFVVPTQGVLLDVYEDTIHSSELITNLLSLGLALYTVGEHNVYCAEPIEEIKALEMMKDGEIDLVISLASKYDLSRSERGCTLRKASLDANTSFISNVQLAEKIIDSLIYYKFNKLNFSSWSNYLNLME